MNWMPKRRLVRSLLASIIICLSTYSAQAYSLRPWTEMSDPEFELRFVEEYLIYQNKSQGEIKKYLEDYSKSHKVVITTCLYCRRIVRVVPNNISRWDLSSGVCNVCMEKHWRIDKFEMPETMKIEVNQEIETRRLIRDLIEPDN